MPRLGPVEWIQQAAIDVLLELYEEDSDFVRHWEQLKRRYDSLLTQLTKVHIFALVSEMVTTIPHDLVAWQIDIRRLNDYLRSTRPYMSDYRDRVQLDKMEVRIRKKLAPYVSDLTNLASDWNIRAPWAAEELLYHDICKALEEIFEAAGVVSINNLADEQIGACLRHVEPHLASERFTLGAASLFLTHGRQELLVQINEQLAGFEQRLKTAGAKEPPSALRKHAKWWFDHYVHNVSFRDIANNIAKIDPQGGPQPENIRNAVKKFSELIGIEPIARTKG